MFMDLKDLAYASEMEDLKDEYEAKLKAKDELLQSANNYIKVLEEKIKEYKNCRNCYRRTMPL